MSMLQLICVSSQVLFFPCLKLIIIHRIPKNNGKMKFNWNKKSNSNMYMHHTVWKPLVNSPSHPHYFSSIGRLSSKEHGLYSVGVWFEN